MENNHYIPKVARIINIKNEVEGARPIKTFRTQFLNGDGFAHGCGQSAMLSVLGKGESMISISSSPIEAEYLQFSVLKTGRVTSALHDMKVGEMIGIRGP
ncbi:MAG: heterodisulfide reductase subunit F, partial [Candidatus Aminicenantes bacterium]|nr:heterodisulfide reductase subunit F [Candidatus Aminicenantes bacterium]